MGDYCKREAWRCNCTPKVQRDNEPQSGSLDEKQVDESNDTSGQILTEGQSVVNLLFTYGVGRPPLILHFDTFKEVFKMLNDRKSMKPEDFPIYLLEIVDGEVRLGRKIYPISEHKKVGG